MQNFQNLFSFIFWVAPFTSIHVYVLIQYIPVYDTTYHNADVILDSLEIWYIKWLKSNNFKVLLIGYWNLI